MASMREAVYKAMSALGQKQTFAVQQSMSALPPKADIRLNLSRTKLLEQCSRIVFSIAGLASASV